MSSTEDSRRSCGICTNTCHFLDGKYRALCCLCKEEPKEDRCDDCVDRSTDDSE